jgi:hypothetical protein
MTQQTAMEKLFINLESIDITINKGVKKVFLEIEKEQIIKACYDGYYKEDEKYTYDYYNETYGK